LTVLSYVGIIKAKIPNLMREGYHWQTTMFYICASLTMAFSLYNIVGISLYIMEGQGLALRGAPGSLVRTVGIYQKQWRFVGIVLVSSLLSMMLAGISITWMKLDGHTAGCTELGEPCESECHPVECWLHRYWMPLIVSIILMLTVLAMFGKVRELQLQMGIAPGDLVRGDMRLQKADVRASGDGATETVCLTAGGRRGRSSARGPAASSWSRPDLKRESAIVSDLDNFIPTRLRRGGEQLHFSYVPTLGELSMPVPEPPTLAGVSVPGPEGMRRHVAAALSSRRFRGTRRAHVREHNAGRAIERILRLNRLKHLIRTRHHTVGNVI